MSMTKWRKTTLGAVVEKVDERQGRAVVPLVLSVTEKRGIIPQNQVFTTRVATSDTTKYKVLQPLDIAYNPYLLWSNAIGQWKGVDPGVTSPVYETFRVSGNNEPRFVGLLLESGILTSYFDSTAIGSIPRRRRTPVPVFLQASVWIPPLPEQRHIVEVMSAVDAHIEAVEDEWQEVKSLLDACAESLIEASDGVKAKLGDVLEIARGGSPRPIYDYFTSDQDGLNWIKIGDVPADGKFITATAQRIRKDGLSRSRAVSPGDFLLSNSMSFSRPYILKISGCIHDGWLKLSKVDEHFDAEYLYFLLRSRSVQAKFESLAAGSGVRNLNIKVVSSVEVVVPPTEQQIDTAQTLTTIGGVADLVAAELDSLRAFRSSLLTALLSQTVTIPEAYDAVLEVSA